jgi:hypothetical protein
MATLYLRPTAAGDETSILYQYPDNGEHWDKVDEASPDEHITRLWNWMYDLTWRRDLYALENTTQVGSINWIKAWVRGIATSNNLGYINTAIKTGGTVYDGAGWNVPSIWTNFSTQYTTNPSTELPWTWEELNALQAGISLQSWPGGYWPYGTQVYVEVDYSVLHEKSISDTIVIADSLSKAISVPKSDIIAIADAISKAVGVPKLDTIAIADSAIYINTGGGIGFHSAVAQRRYKSVEFDTFTFPNPAGGGFSSANDGYYLIAGLGVVSPAVKNVGLFRTDTLAIADALVRAIGLGKADTISITDSFAKVSEFYRSMEDTITIADLAAYLKAINLVLSDTISIVDSEAKAIGIPKADLITIADLATYLKFLNLFLSDTITITDGETKVIGKNLSDLIIITDGEVPIGALFVPPGIYQIEVHNTDGTLVAILEKAFDISLEEKVNSPKVASFAIPSDDSKLTYVTRARELWVRDVANNTVIAKTKLLRKEDARN